MDIWNSIFAEKGKVFIKPHPDMEKIVEIFHERKSRKILDLGCGTGRHLVYFSKHGFEVYGLDAAPKGLEIAQQWLFKENLKAKLTQHRIEKRFPFEDNFFDVIISIQVIHHAKIETIKKIVAEITRVLKKNGIIFITVPQRNFHKEYGFKEIEPGTIVPLDGPEKGLPHHYFTPEELRELFKAFEIKSISIDSVEHYTLFGIKL